MLSLYLFDIVDCLIIMMMIISYRIVSFRCFTESIISLTKGRMSATDGEKIYYIILYRNQQLNWFIVMFWKRLRKCHCDNVCFCCDR
jgi:hypothetical protein